MRFGKFAQCSHLIRRIDPAIFRGIGDRQRVRLCPMNTARRGRQLLPQRLCRDFGTLALNQRQLGAMSVKFWRATFIILDMRVLMAQHAAIRRAEASKGNRIGGSARRNPNRCHVLFKDVRQQRFKRLANGIPIISRIDMIGPSHGLKHSRMHTGGIVRKKAHGQPLGGSFPSGQQRRKGDGAAGED